MQEHLIRGLTPEQLAESPRTEEEINFWFATAPKRRKWKATERDSWRLRLAMIGDPANRAALLQPFVDKKPSRTEFNTAHVAAILGTKEALDLAKERKADLTAIWLKKSCLSIAAQLGHVEFVKLLLEEGLPELPSAQSPLAAAIQHKQAAVVELLIEGAVPADLGAAIRSGDVKTMELFKGKVELPDNIVPLNEDTALAVLAAFPEVRPSALAGAGLVTEKLAQAIVTQRPTLTSADIAPHLARMNLAGLKVLFDACEDLTAPINDEGTLIQRATKTRVEVLEELMSRGLQIDIDEVLDDSYLKAEIREYLSTLGAPLSDEAFLENPFAAGFEGRFRKSFFGFNIGDERKKKSSGLSDVHLTVKKGVVQAIDYRTYQISGDAFAAISKELDARFGKRKSNRAKKRVWSDAQATATLSYKVNDAGTEISLAVEAS